MKVGFSLLLFLATGAGAATLPGFRVELVGGTAGFATSLAVDSRGTVYYTTIDGTIYQLAGDESRTVANVVTDGAGNSGLLGMALLDDDTAVVHYTTPRQTHDVVARIDLSTGAEQVINAFVVDIEAPERGSSTEHHGGNPSVAADGSIFVGIGDCGSEGLAQASGWNGGRVFRITPDGEAREFARGLRNPFDVAWDEEQQRLIVADNGPIGGDEIHVIAEGANCGWPYTWGDRPSDGELVPPDYVFQETVAPTGMIAVNGAHPMLRRGILLGAFVTKAIYYFPDVRPREVAAPIVLLEDEVGPVIDLAQTAAGEILFTSGFGIYRLLTPRRGDCDGDGALTSADLAALGRELADGSAQRAIDAQDGGHRGSWGCDANSDGLISEADTAEMIRLLYPHPRAVRRGR